MPRSPSFQFYPGDWLRNDVSGCSLEAQGLWLRLMIVMHDAQVYGQLVLNSEPMPVEFVAKKVGISPKKYSNLLRELESAGVINRKENGVIFSGRMERDDRERQLNRERQARYYEKSNGKPNANSDGDLTAVSRQPNAKPNGASSSSSSSSIKKEEELRTTTTAKPKISDDEWLNSLQTNPAYKPLNVRMEFARAGVWAETNNRQCTRRFFVAWLNRAKPMEVKPKGVNKNGSINGGSREHANTKALREWAEFAKTGDIPAA